jgi:hypothetical protein
MTRTTADGFATAWHAECRAVPAPTAPGAWAAFDAARAALTGALGLDRDDRATAQAMSRILSGPAGDRIARAALAAIRRGTDWPRAIAHAAWLDALTAEAATKAARRHTKEPRA